ncbi:MAG: alpha-galactosidase [Prevotella sp.]|nr:alpha-galactosidase [Prevotella sp.]
MKHLLLTALLLACCTGANAGEERAFRIQTSQMELVLKVGPDGRLYQVYFGNRLADDEDTGLFSWKTNKGNDSTPDRGLEPMGGLGGEDPFEPALAMTHNDGRQDTYLYFKGAEEVSGMPAVLGQKDGQYGPDMQGLPADNNVKETVITLEDRLYPVTAIIHYKAFWKENVIVVWSEFLHKEKKPVTLSRMGCPTLFLKPATYVLTHYHGDWAREGRPETTTLTFGKKILDTRMGSRAAEQCEPFFELTDGRSTLLGTIAWTGNFRLTFEVDNVGGLRIAPAVNPTGSLYQLDRDKLFRTPDFIFTMSEKGADEASRQLHNWARNYQLKDGNGGRMTLLNNWENTGFDFDQERLSRLMHEASDLGVDMFLLDDGWFGNEFPRNDDHAGLGDWQENRQKLPEGIPGLLDAAKEAGVKFGIWIEPEMVNPRSKLFEKHPDWALHYPDREVKYHRNQLVLDLSNPDVQDHVFGIVDRIMQVAGTKSGAKGVAFFKWDCNAMITSPYSSYLKDRQCNLYIDHVRGLYRVLDRIKAKYPQLPMMLCSGGGGRCDYKALEYFTEFWPSDNTDPFERLYIQWSFSKFFPVKSMAAHVTNWNRHASMKFRVDVASMCKLGFDISLADMPAADHEFCKRAVENYARMKPVILDGDLYRLVSPYETPHMAVCYVAKDRQKAVLFAYDLHPRTGDPRPKVQLQGLDPDTEYTVTETNLRSKDDRPKPQTYTGRYLTQVGLDILSAGEGRSRVFEITAR